MVYDPLLLILLVLGLAAGWVGVMSFGRTFGRAALSKLPFVKPPVPKWYFVRWLTCEHLERLRQAGVNCAPYTVRGEGGNTFEGKDLKRVLEVLQARIVATFPCGVDSTREIVLSFKRAPDPSLDNLKVTVTGSFDHSSVLFWRKIIARRRVEAIVREVFLPVVRKNIVVHLSAGRTNKAQNDDNSFHIYAWSSPSGSWRKNPPERLWGVPVPHRDQSFDPSRAGIPIVETASDYVAAELVGDNCLYLHFNAISRGNDLELALLARTFDAVREELQVDRFLAEIVRTLPADGLPIGEANASGFAIYDQGFDGRRQGVVKSLITQILIPAVRSDVYVTQCNYHNQQPLEDGMFHVFFASAPLGRPTVKSPERLWGYRLLKSETLFLPSGQGQLIVDDTGFAVGELVGSNLYIYGDLIHYGCSKGAALFAKLLMEVRRELAALQKPRDAAVLAQQFADECWYQIAKLGVTNSNSAAAAANTKQAGAQLAMALRAARTAEQEAYRLESTPEESIGREFDELCKIKKVLDIHVGDSYLTVTTDVLYCTDPRDGVKHEIGAFKIAIPIGKGGSPNWQNQTRRVSGPDNKKMNAPHVDPNGNACLGNTKDTFPDLIAKREFASAVELAIAFVESVNTSDAWGKFISNWPVAVG